jgi:hypothetical protein
VAQELECVLEPVTPIGSPVGHGLRGYRHQPYCDQIAKPIWSQ